MKSCLIISVLCLLTLSHIDKALSQADSALGRRDGHEPGQSPLLGRPDGHEPGSKTDQSPLLGRPDGHEPGSQSDGPGLLGRPDGHEPGSKTDQPPLLGRPDGHEPKSQSDDTPLLGEPDEQPDSSQEDSDLSHTDDTAIGYEDVSAELLDDEEPKQLTRCKRPLCEIYCEGGYLTDSSGCPTCQCSDIDNSSELEVDPADICDLPMCAMFCENGFKTGDDGCPVCECKEDEGLPGRQDGHELADVCANQPLCRMYCKLGFQTDERGCSVCACLTDPCPTVDCPGGTICQPLPCKNASSCTQLPVECVASSYPCPEPMCANACPNGYSKNEQGCMTCNCQSIPAERICGAVNCDEGQVCRNSSDDSPPKCSIKTLCETQRQMTVGLGQTAVQCEPDGLFKPLQCNPKLASCWCVDGFGREINGTRTTVYIDEHKPRCPRNNTVSMHIHMKLSVTHDIDLKQIDSLHTAIVDHVSSWLLIEPHYVKLSKAETAGQPADEYKNYDGANDDDDDTDEAGPRLLIVELVIMHDGQSDLPSADRYLRHRMHQGRCDIPVGTGTLQPDLDSFEIEHRFAQKPVMPENIIAEPDRCEIDRHAWPCWGSLRMAVCITGTVLFVLFVASVVLAVRRRHRTRSSLFQHQKLESQVSIEKDYLTDHFEKLPSDDFDSPMMKEKKMPIA